MKPRKLTAAWVRRLIPRRPPASQKGRNGHVLLVAGSRGMAGAAVLSGLGVLRSGAGLLTVGIVSSERRIITTRLPESMTLPLPETRAGYLAAQAVNIIRDYVRRRKITTLAVGPGLTAHPSVARMVKALLGCGLPIVVDADGLNSLSLTSFRRKPETRAMDWAPAFAGVTTIITPHPGELARLLRTTSKKIQKDRLGIAAKTAKQLAVICVLKGHETVISDGARTFINTTGNQAMATGGMGDVLTGVIAGFLAQGLLLLDAACAGVYLHGLAGDLARVSDRGLVATDVAANIPRALKKIGIR